MLAGGPGRSSALYKAKAIIFRQGDPADAVFHVERGGVQLTVVSDHGKEGVVAILGPGDFFGEGCLAGQLLHMASAGAMAASTVVRIEKETMIRMLHEQPALSAMFMAFLLSRNIQIEADLVDQLFNSSERRLARLLRDGRFHVNLIEYNATSGPYTGSSYGRREVFMRALAELGLEASVRRSRGADVAAACGQLARSRA